MLFPSAPSGNNSTGGNSSPSATKSYVMNYGASGMSLSSKA